LADTPFENIGDDIQLFTLAPNFSTKRREELLIEILLLYDLLESVWKSVEEAEDSLQREKLREIVAPFAHEVRCATDILVALFTDIAFRGRPLTPDIQRAWGKAIQAQFDGYRNFLDRVALAFVPPKEIDPRTATVTDVVAVGRTFKRKSKRAR
jgi:hypothetical protein